jgi:hypothetical protein
MDSDIGILRMMHFMKIEGFTVDPQFLLPFGRLEGRGDLGAVLGERSGVADLALADAAGHDLTQQPTMQLQGFGRYAMTPAWDLRVGVSHVIDGETKLAGVSRHDEAHVTNIQLGTAAFVGTTTQLLATWGRDLKVDDGFKESSRINLRLLQLF